jgi:[acyl-carrier-protein] S-malonyltransferase
MKPAQERMAQELEAVPFADLKTPLVNNWQAAEVRTGDESRRGLFEQIPNSVRWTDTIRYIANNGATRFIEVGAGGVLTGLLRNIDAGLTGMKFGEAADWEKVSASLS